MVERNLDRRQRLSKGIRTHIRNEKAKARRAGIEYIPSPLETRPPAPPSVTLEDSTWARMEPWLKWQIRYGSLVEDLMAKASKPEPYSKSDALKQLTENSGDYMSIWEHAKAFDKGNQDAFLKDSDYLSDLFGPVTLLMRTQSLMLAKLSS